MAMRDESAATSRAACGERGEPTRRAHSFELWYLEHRGAVYRYVRYRVATPDAADDVTSEVFLKALRSFHRYDPGRAAPRTWLLRIARNAVTDHLRAHARRRSLQVPLDRVEEPVAQGPSPEDGIVRRERLRRIRDRGRGLRERDREVLSLRFAAGLSNGEIADRLGITSNAAAVRVHRALARLRRAVLA